MSIVAKRYRSLFVALFATFVLFGISATIVGAALPTILSDFGWSYGVAGALMGAGALGAFLAMVFAGKIIDRVGARTILAAGFALDTASLVFFGIKPDPVLNILLYFGLGVGQALLEVGVNWVSLHMDEEGSGRPMNLMHGAFSIGAVVGPFILGILLSSSLRWTYLLRGISGLYGLLFLITFLLPLRRLPAAALASEKGLLPKKTNTVRYLGFLALLFYVGTELGLSNWAAEYFVRDFSWGPAQASFVVSIFWAGLSVGRFGFPIFLGRIRPDRLLIGISVLLAAAIALLAGLGGVGLPAAPFALAAVALAGLGASCVYPNVITLVGAAYVEAPGAAISNAAGGGAFGSLVFPFLMSAISTAWGVRAGFVFYALMAVVSLVVCTALARAITTGKMRKGLEAREDRRGKEAGI